MTTNYYLYYLQMDDGRYLVYRSSRSDWDSWNDRVLRVWCEGPKGGVKVIQNRTFDSFQFGYITTSEEAMKTFMWVKLSAKESKYVN